MSKKEPFNSFLKRYSLKPQDLQELSGQSAQLLLNWYNSSDKEVMIAVLVAAALRQREDKGICHDMCFDTHATISQVFKYYNITTFEAMDVSKQSQQTLGNWLANHDKTRLIFCIVDAVNWRAEALRRTFKATADILELVMLNAPTHEFKRAHTKYYLEDVISKKKRVNK